MDDSPSSFVFIVFSNVFAFLFYLTLSVIQYEYYLCYFHAVITGGAMCGWLWKVSESILSNAWKRRWFILDNNGLSYYNHDLALDAVKNVVNCNDVVSIKEDSFKGS